MANKYSKLHLVAVLPKLCRSKAKFSQSSRSSVSAAKTYLATGHFIGRVPSSNLLAQVRREVVVSRKRLVS